jgi:hypothetical protein
MKTQLKSFESRDGGYMEAVLSAPKVGTGQDTKAWDIGYRDFVNETTRSQIFESDHPSARDYADGWQQAYRESPEV